MHLLLVLLIVTLTSITPAFAGKSAGEHLLLPTPKFCQWRNEASFTGGKYQISDSLEISPGKLELFRKTLKDIFNWENDANGAIVIQINRTPRKHNPEYYTLDIKNNRINITADSKKGVMRAFSRLLSIFMTPLAKIKKDGSVVLPGLFIKDQPDFPVRGIMLASASLFPRTRKKDLLEYAERFIDRAAAMQFNHLFFEIGGRLKSDKNPEINPSGPIYTKTELSKLVNYARNRGMKVSPMINSIAHMERAPLVFPIYSKHHYSKKTVPYAMDIGNPKFWEVFLGYIDEVLEVFGNTEYFAIGTDEFHRQVKLIEKACGKPCLEFFPEYLNRVNRHLRKRGVETMIYHDMLGRRGLHGWPEETCNGVKDARKMLPKIDKDINILYWNYSCSRRFPFLKDLSDAGFKKLWVLPWFGEEPVKALLKKAYAIGAKVLVTQWALTTHRNQFVHGSEFAWNIKNKSPKTTFDFNDLNDFLFYGRSSKKFVNNAESVTLSGAETPPEVFRGKLEQRFHGHKANAYGIPVDFSSMRAFGVSGGISPEIPHPWNFKKMLKDETLKDVYLYTDSSMQTLKLNKKTKVNEKRKSGDVVIYDSSYGKSTLNNNRGAEFAVDAKGKITRLSGNCRGRTCDETGNMEIPKDGFVISRSGGQAVFYYKQYDFYPSLREGDRLHVATLKKGAPVKDYISGKLNPSLRNVVIFINPRNVVKNGLLAQIKLYFVNGKTATFRLGSSFFFTGPCKFLDIPVWKRWIAWDMVRYGLRPVLALEWNSPKNYRDLKSIKIIPTQAGIDAGLTVLGVTQY